MVCAMSILFLVTRGVNKSVFIAARPSLANLEAMTNTVSPMIITQMAFVMGFIEIKDAGSFTIIWKVRKSNNNIPDPRSKPSANSLIAAAYLLLG